MSAAELEPDTRPHVIVRPWHVEIGRGGRWFYFGRYTRGNSSGWRRGLRVRAFLHQIVDFEYGPTYASLSEVR